MGKNKAVLVTILLITVPLLLTACFKTNKKPVASFTVSSNSGYAPLEVSFNATDSYDPDGSILTYQWDFKDGSTGSGETISHTFDTQGNYNVRLTVADDEGAKDSTTRLIEILQAPLWVDRVARAWVVAHPHNWDADAENDGLRVWAELQDEDEEIIKYELYHQRRAMNHC